MKKLCISLLLQSVILLLANPSEAQVASFTGQWSGTGTAVTHPGTPQAITHSCASISLTLNQTDSEMDLQAGSYTCEDIEADYGTAQFELKQGQVWYNGTNIGTLSSSGSDSRFFISYVTQDDGSVFQLTLTLNGSNLSYQEDWYNSPQDPAVQMEVRGTLTNH